MANYHAFIRTNYFGVTDETKFRDIIASCCSEGDIEIFEGDGGTGKFAFGCHGSIYGILDCTDDEYDIYAFYHKLQSVLRGIDVIIITEVGYEKMRYLTGICTVITKQDIACVTLGDKGLELARSMLGDPSFDTQMEY